MAFALAKTAGTEGVSATTLTFEDWFSAADGLLAGDYIMVVCCNQTGTATALELTSSTGSWTKLDSTDSPRVGSFLRSQIWWHKYDGTTLPTAPTAANGANTRWVGISWVVRDAPDVPDQSWIDVNARTDNSILARVFPISSVTTTEADCLLLTVYTRSGASAFEKPDRFWGVDFLVARKGDDDAVFGNTVSVTVASRAQYTAGATPAYDYVTANAGGVRTQIWNIAIKNKVGGAKPIGVTNPPTRVTDFFENNTFPTGLVSLSTIHATIEGVSTFAPSTNSMNTQNGLATNPPVPFWTRRFLMVPPAATTGVSGLRWNLPAAVDYTAGLWMMSTRSGNSSADSILGPLHYFEDSGGNWGVYRFISRPSSIGVQTIICHLPDETPVDGSVTPVDFTDITKRGIAYRQTAANISQRFFDVASECIQPFATPLTLLGGGLANPITARTVAKMLSSGGAWNLAFAQGLGQQVITMPYQIGDGTVATYVDDEAQSLEYPSVGGIIGYTVLAGRQEIRVKASASDTILFDAGIKGTSRIHNFVFDSATSTSATYGTAGTFLGFDFTAKTGVNVQGATFIECPEIDAKGAQFNNCIIKKTTSVDAAIAFDANSSMDGTTIDVTGTNATFHLELGASVTAFTLTNCTFTGAPSTDKVSVLATAGTVDITLSNTTLLAGDITTAGATVNLITPLNTVSITGITAGSRIQIYNVTTDSEVVNTTVAGTSYTATYEEGTGYSEDDTIRVRLTYVSGASAKAEFQGSAVVGSTGWSFLAEQVDNTVYNSFGVDGSTITQFQADYLTDQVDIVTAVNFNISQFYAWWVYNLSTEDGIRDFFGGITALDEANFRINTGVLSLYLDNSTNTNIRQLDNRRFFRLDGAYPVLDPTTGGGEKGIATYTTH
jgi:hypothetical protein